MFQISRRFITLTCLVFIGTFSIFFQSAWATNYAWEGDKINDYLEKWDPNVKREVSDPFTRNAIVNEIQPTKTAYFVRVYDGKTSTTVGSWLMPASELRGLTPAQIKEKFALENTPAGILYVKVPGNARYAYVRGTAGPIASWGQGGGDQLYIIGKHTDGTDPLPPPPYDEARFSDYLKLFQNPDGSSDPTDHNYFNNQDSLSSSTLLYAPIVTTGNANRVASYLDTLQITKDTNHDDLGTIYAVLDSLKLHSPGTLAAALNNIFNPERYDAINAVGYHNELAFGDALFDRNKARRQDIVNNLVNNKKNTAKKPKNTDVWLHAIGNYMSQNDNTDHTGFNAHSTGFAGGVDFHPRQNFIIGFGTTYLQNNLDWNNNGGNATVHNAKLGAYASYFTPKFFVDSALTGGVNWATAARHIINVSGISYGAAGTASGQLINDPDLVSGDRNADSNQTGQSFALHFKSGLNLKWQNLDFVPLARLSYIYLTQNSFSENGADDADLSLNSFNTQTIRAQIGAQFGRSFKTENSTQITPNIELGVAHDFPLNRHVITYTIPNTSSNSFVEGYHREVNSFIANLGLVSKFKNGFTISGKYTSEYGSGLTSQQVTLGVAISF